MYGEPWDSEYLGSGTLLWEDIEKYGRENFTREILEYCDSEESLKDREYYYLKLYDVARSPEYYNQVVCRWRDGISQFRFSEESRQKMSESAKRKFKDPEILRRYQKPHRVTDALLKSNRRLSKLRIGVPVQDPEIISLRMKGPGNHRYGKKMEDDVKSKIGKSVSDSYKTKKGYKYVTDGVSTRFVGGETLEILLKSGWYLGRHYVSGSAVHKLKEVK